MPLANFSALDGDYDLCVVGAGPAGLACALASHANGLRVLVLEAGGEDGAPGSAVLDAELNNPARHDPVDQVMCGGLGGTSQLWSGRTLPYDEVDFRLWPIKLDDLTPHYQTAREFFGCPDALTPPPPDTFARLRRFEASSAESFCEEPNLQRRLHTALNDANGPTIVLNARVARIIIDQGRVTSVQVRDGDGVRAVRAANFVIACGGLSSLRLLLLTQRDNPALFGGVDGPLGRGYMGHLAGAVADLAPVNPGDIAAFQAALSANVLRRRQIRPRAATITGEEIGNISFWLEAPSIDDASHGSATASARYILSRSLQRHVKPTRYGVSPPLAPHLANIARAPGDLIVDMAKRVLSTHAARKPPGAPAPLTSAGDGAWRLAYHAEQSAEPTNRVSLSAARDRFGDPKLSVAFDFSAHDIASVARAHDLLDADLRDAGAGRLRWIGGREETEDRIRDEARDGYHQIGGAIMSKDARTGIVDTQCRAHGVDNLWIASSCVFPSSGRANPTLTIVALAHRIAASGYASSSASQ